LRHTFLAALAGLGVNDVHAGLEWLSPELRRIEAERQGLQQTLATLPPTPTPQVTQRLGWHSDYSASPNAVEWVELNLGTPNGSIPWCSSRRPRPAVPSSRATDSRCASASSCLATTRRLSVRSSRISPARFPESRLAARRHSRRRTYRAQGAHHRDATLPRRSALSFCAWRSDALAGTRNLGPQLEVIGPAAVHASSSQGTRPDWGRINVVDGHTVLGPPLGTRPSPTLGFRSQLKHEKRAPPGPQPWVSVDLGSVVPVGEVRLFPAHPPQFAHSHGYGFPVRYQIELREEAGRSAVRPARAGIRQLQRVARR